MTGKRAVSRPGLLASRRGASQAGEVFDYQAVLAMADAALYRAKHGGRDQVCRALPSELPQLGVPAFA